MTKLILVLILLGHTIVSGLVFQHVSILSVFPPFEESHTYQIFSDLLVSISLVMFFIYRELRRRKKSLTTFYVCCAGVIVMGSFSPLIYLLLDKDLLSNT